MRIDAITIFPAYFEPLRLSLLGRAGERGLVDLRVHDLRDWTHDRHRTVDDAPAGGGAGMVMRPEPWGEALAALTATAAPAAAGSVSEEGTRLRLVVPTPSGHLFTQRDAETYARTDRLVIACGRYEGIDARVVDWARTDLGLTVDEVSIGDYVLAGGEAAALVIVEATTRLLPGVLGNPTSLAQESHGRHGPGLLEYPVYTKPREWNGHSVPAVLLSGDHAAVERWRRDQALLRTMWRRPELLTALGADALDARDREVLGAQGRDAIEAG